VLAYGTGALNIEACRVATTDDIGRTRTTALGVMNDDAWQPKAQASESHAAGRWPTNVVLSHAGNDVDGDLCANGCVPGCPVAELDRQSGARRAGGVVAGGDHYASAGYEHGIGGSRVAFDGYGDEGGASRYFPTFRYEAKAPAAERPKVGGEAHATVKPLALMRWLVRLVTPPGGMALEPFAGSGTTIEACLVEGFRCIAVEREARYLPLVMARISKPIESVLPFDAPEVSDAELR
jgi:site-specific DNA-methyltransferase (adenine-specific)